MAVDMRLAAKGKNEPRDGLLQQARVSAALAKQYAVQLDAQGWSSDDTAALNANIAKVEGSVGTQKETRGEATTASGGEAAAIAGVKKYLRKLRNALPRAMREAKIPGLTIDAFHAGETLGRSTPKLSKFLVTIRPAVAKLDTAEGLKKHFKDGGALAALDAAKIKLDGADVDQELALQNAPDATKALYEAMGALLENIEDLNRAGKSAFDEDAGTLGKFNKDVLLRARKATAEAEPEKVPEQPKGGDPAGPK